MSNLSITGEIKTILAVENGESKAGKAWTKQNFVINTGAQFNPEVCFQVFGEEKIAALANYKVGQTVEVLFNVSSREFNSKYYHNLDAWKLKEAEGNTPMNQAPVMKEEDDSLPF